MFTIELRETMFLSPVDVNISVPNFKATKPIVVQIFFDGKTRSSLEPCHYFVLKAKKMALHLCRPMCDVFCGLCSADVIRIITVASILAVIL